MRQIVLDTETTGLDPKSGHRLVEIGCVELINYIPTGRVFHQYINPERDMPIEAQQVHGLTREFLKKHPVFAEIAGGFVEFLEDAPLIIHNAEFDMRFLNHELKLHGFAEMPLSRAIDTVKIARQKFPGAPANLDALCKRFAIDNSMREKHGALLDAELLAEVYLELIGGRQAGLELVATAVSSGGGAQRSFLAPRQFPAEAGEDDAHAEMLKKLPNNLWGAN